MGRNIIEKLYTDRAISDGFLYLNRIDVQFEEKYEKIREKINEKYKLGINKNTKTDEKREILSRIIKSNEHINELGSMAILIDIIDYFEKLGIRRNSHLKRRLHIYEYIKEKIGFQLYKDYLIYDKDNIIFIEINSLKEFLELSILNKIKYFRGHSSLNYKLFPSIYRNDDIIYESKYFNELLVRYPDEFINHKTTFEKLTKMQHYEAPTRLLDITSNPLVAMYFVCENYKNNSLGEIILFDVNDDEIKYFNSDTVAIISNISKMNINFKCKELDRKYKDEKERITNYNSEDDIKYLINEIRQEKSSFLPIIHPDDINDVYFVKPVMGNNRILKQEGAFILFGIDGEKNIPANIRHIYFEEGKRVKIIIPDQSKTNILLELDKFGINKGTMFPEIDNFSKYLFWKYKEKTL
jgi:hypothetical protein